MTLQVDKWYHFSKFQKCRICTSSDLTGNLQASINNLKIQVGFGRISKFLSFQTKVTVIDLKYIYKNSFLKNKWLPTKKISIFQRLPFELLLDDLFLYLSVTGDLDLSLDRFTFLEFLEELLSRSGLTDLRSNLTFGGGVSRRSNLTSHLKI